jgi:hypothetical protein
VGHGGLRTGPTSRCPQPSARAKLPSVTRGAPLPPSPGKGHLGGTPSSHRLGICLRQGPPSAGTAGPDLPPPRFKCSRTSVAMDFL